MSLRPWVLLMGVPAFGLKCLTTHEKWMFRSLLSMVPVTNSLPSWFSRAEVLRLGARISVFGLAFKAGTDDLRRVSSTPSKAVTRGRMWWRSTSAVSGAWEPISHTSSVTYPTFSPASCRTSSGFRRCGVGGASRLTLTFARCYSTPLRKQECWIWQVSATEPHKGYKTSLNRALMISVPFEHGYGRPTISL